MMSENSDFGMITEATIPTAVAIDELDVHSNGNFVQLPPLVEDNEGIGLFMDDELQYSGPSDSEPRRLDVHTDQAMHLENSSQRNTVIKLLDARRDYEITLRKLITRIEYAIRENRRKQKALILELKRIREHDDFIERKKVPLQLFFPPYFRDIYDMVPNVNNEARRRAVDGAYDSLIREEKKWTSLELSKLRVAVLKSVLEKRLEPFVERRECIIEKINHSGRETSEEDKEQLRQRVLDLNRTIQYQLSLPEHEILTADKTDYSEVDWLKISNIDFLGIRTPKQIRLKWVYEQSPQWNKAEWSLKELQKLYSLRKESCIDWSIVADDMGTNRTPYQCLEKYKTTVGPLLYSKPWTKQEDGKLSVLVKALQRNGDVPWSVVSMFMDGRSQYESRNRYEQFSLPGRNYGKWNVAEDVALLCAVARYGTRDWTKVANMLVSRSRTQCRERWMNMFNKRIADTPWTLAEDEKLIYGIKVFGKGKWTQISTLVPGRSANDCKMRFRSLINTKLKMCTDSWNKSLVRADTTASRRRRRQKVGEHFAELVRLDREDVEADLVGKCDEAVDDDSELLVGLDPERRKAIAGRIDEINKRACSGGSMKKWLTLLDDLRITSDMLDDTTLSIVKRYCDGESILSVRDRRTLLSVEERARFNNYLKELPDDSAKVSFIMDSLFELVERADSKHQCDDEMLQKLNVGDELYKYFEYNLIDVLLGHLEEGTKPEEIPPCIATLYILDQIKTLMPNLCFEALLLFNPIVTDSNVPYVELSTQLKEDPEYQLLAMKLQSMLHLPMLMDRAIEPESSWRIRETNRKLAKLRRREEASTSNRTSSPQTSANSNALGLPPRRELTVRDVVMGNLSLDASLLMPRGGDSLLVKDPETTTAPAAPVQTVAMYLASTLQLKKRAKPAPKEMERLAKLDESIESVCTRVKNMPPEEFLSFAEQISNECNAWENGSCSRIDTIERESAGLTWDRQQSAKALSLHKDRPTTEHCAVKSSNADVEECKPEQPSPPRGMSVADKEKEETRICKKRAAPRERSRTQKRSKRVVKVQVNQKTTKKSHTKPAVAENAVTGERKRKRAQEGESVGEEQLEESACERIRSTKRPGRGKDSKTDRRSSKMTEPKDLEVNRTRVGEDDVPKANGTPKLPTSVAKKDGKRRNRERVIMNDRKTGTDGAGASFSVIPSAKRSKKRASPTKTAQRAIQKKSQQGRRCGR